jgi:hypothetical protein
MGNAYNNASLLVTPNGYRASKIYSAKPTDGTGDLAFSRASTAMRRNSAGLWESVANNVPRLQYPVGVGCPSWLFEPQATNGIRNNTMAGGVAGTPGTLPNFYSDSVGVLTREIVGFGTEDGLSYMDIRFFGISGGSFLDIFYDTSTSIAASVGQVWNLSSYIKIIAAPAPPVSYQLCYREFNSGGSFLTIQQGPSLALTTTLTQYSYSRTISQATAAFVQPSLFFNITLAATYDFTLRIAVPQLELGSVATSPIITAGSAVTRLADVASKTSATALIGQTEGSIYFDLTIGQSLNDSTSKTICAISDGTANNRIDIYRFNNLIYYDNLVGGVLQFSNSVFTITSFNTRLKGCINYQLNSVKTFINGALTDTDTTALIPACSRFDEGNTRGNAVYNGLIDEVILYKTALSDSEAIELTTL